MDLSTSATAADGWTVLHVAGEIDVLSAPVLRSRLDDQIRAGNNRLVIDLSEVRFMDSMGLGVLVGRLKFVRIHRGTIVLAGPSERVRRVFDITGLDKVFDIYDSVPSAIASA